MRTAPWPSREGLSSLTRRYHAAQQFTQRLKENTNVDTALAMRDGRVNAVKLHEYVSTGPRNGRSGRMPARRALSPSPLPLDPNARPVYAGDVGPGTWVVELPGRAMPVTVPAGAVAVLAGCLAPHAYVTPVQSAVGVAPGALRSIA
jgi:hypothetical protein